MTRSLLLLIALLSVGCQTPTEKPHTYGPNGRPLSILDGVQSGALDVFVTNPFSVNDQSDLCWLLPRSDSILPDQVCVPLAAVQQWVKQKEAEAPKPISSERVVHTYSDGKLTWVCDTEHLPLPCYMLPDGVRIDTETRCIDHRSTYDGSACDPIGVPQWVPEKEHR